MRVIAGKAGGRKLRGINKRTTRAITGRIKESVFGILGDLDGLRVLDLFAGTGALGIEALSHGAREVIFVDRDRQCATLIKKNLSSLGLEGRIYSADVKTALGRLAGRSEEFDLVFVDPPFATGLALETLECLDRLSLMGTEGLAIARHRVRKTLPEKVGRLTLERSEKYGESIVCFYRRG